MSLSIKYESAEDARLRLKGTIVKYDGAPHYITDVRSELDGPFRIHCSPLPYKGDAGVRKYISSKKFDIEPFALGYMNNSERDASYLSRAPARQQRQGLSSENLKGCPLPLTVAMQHDCFVDMINGKYPAFAEAVVYSKKQGGIIVAFHREIAVKVDTILDKIVWVYYKGATQPCGAFLDNKFILGDKYKYLAEVLAENGVE